MATLFGALGLLAQETLPLPVNLQDALLGNLGLTAYLLWQNFELRKENRTLDAEAREMTKKALAALDALATKGSGR